MTWAIENRIARNAIALAIEALMICLIAYPTWTVMWHASQPTYLDISVCEIEHADRLRYNDPIPPGTRACQVTTRGKLYFFPEAPTELNARVQAARPSATEWTLLVMSFMAGAGLLGYLTKLRNDWDLGGY